MATIQPVASGFIQVNGLELGGVGVKSLALALCVLVACASEPRTPSPTVRPAGSDTSRARDAGQRSGPLRIVTFSRTTGYRHTSIALALRALQEQLPAAEYTLRSTEDPAELALWLSDSDVLVFLLTTGDVLEDAQQQRVEAFVRAGGGFLGVHSASDTEYDWPFYGELVGAYFDSHPAIQTARLIVEATAHPVVSFLPTTWERRDEWYNFRANPRAEVQVLLRLDETSYTGGTMGSDHPMAWCHEVDRGRALYTAIGHTDESWQEPPFLQHIVHALRWVGRRLD